MFKDNSLEISKMFEEWRFPSVYRLRACCTRAISNSRKFSELQPEQFCCYCCCCQVTSVVSDSVQPHRRQPTRLPHPWDSPGKNTGVGCHFLLQCMKVKSESEATQLRPTLHDPMDWSLPGSSIHGIFQARVLEWGASAFSVSVCTGCLFYLICYYLQIITQPITL